MPFVQGMLVALKLRDLQPKLPVTEAHPKALLWLLPETASIIAPSEHECDAVLCEELIEGKIDLITFYQFLHRAQLY